MRAFSTPKIARGDGYWTGYSEWRDGPRKSPVKRDPIFNKDATPAMVAKIVLFLQQFERTPFEYEGACRHSLRSALCLVGHRWANADAEAARIVSMALRQMNAHRPTWEQGQPEYVIPDENCYRCQGPLDDYQISKRIRFCSKVCAAAHIAHRDTAGSIAENKVASNAYRVVLQAKRPKLTCKECQKEFRPNTPGGKWEYCSRSCSKKAMHRIHASSLTEKACLACGTPFAPKSKLTVFCSDKCGKDVSHIRRQLEKGKRVQLRPICFDYFLERYTFRHRKESLTVRRLDRMLDGA